MAGLIAALFGGKARPADPNPLPGIGGVSMPPGPAGQTGFPGSTAQTRTFRGSSPRVAKIRSDTNAGWESGLSGTPQVRQESYRGDVPGGRTRSPRATPLTVTQQPVLTAAMQQVPGTDLGGPMLQTGPGNITAGGQLPASFSKATTTLLKDAQPIIGEGTPGAGNVRNQVAERYKNEPGQAHAYRPAPRADQAGSVPGGQAADGNVSNTRAAQGEVTVQNRFQMFGTGSQTWSVQRRMPYTGRGDGARGADLNGQRYYAQNSQTNQFWNAGQGDYGIVRQRGGKRPILGFTEPAPWTAQFYDTTDSIGTASNPNPAPSQAASQVYISPGSGRASNSTGRTG